MFIAHWESSKKHVTIFDKILSNNIIKIQGEFTKVDDSGAQNDCSLTLFFSFDIKKIASDKTVIGEYHS